MQPGSRPRTFRYRGFVLMEEPNQSWRVQPERSPIAVLPFRTPSCSLEDAKTMVNLKLAEAEPFIRSAWMPQPTDKPETPQAA